MKGIVSMQSSSRVSAMEMIRSNDKYNFSIPHDESQSTSAASICKHGHCKATPTEMRPIQRKKQVRRRIHTSKPYQERLLNMAEARKEIVTALKLHRASMKRQQQGAIIPALMRQIPSQQQPQQELPTFMDPAYSSTAVQDYFTNPNAARPAPDPPTTGALHEEDECSSSSGRCEGGAVEPRALDEEEMAQIRSIGEMHQMEWDDTLNFATYACWFRFLQEMELSGEDDHSLCLPNKLDK